MTTSDPRAGGYSFVSQQHCNMCGADAASTKVLGRRMNASQGIRPVRRVGLTTTVVRCRRCRLVFANPLPVPEHLDQHYGKDPSEYWRESYFASDSDYFSAQIATFQHLHPRGGASTVLDVGSGIGKCLVALQNAGYDAHGLEPSAKFVAYAVDRLRIAPERLQNVSVEEAEYPNETFDLITFGAVLEHLYDPAGAIARALSWLTAGGLIHAEVPSSRWLVGRLFNAIYRAQGLDYVTNISPMHRPFHLYEFDLECFRLHGRRAGYHVALSTIHTCETFLPPPASQVASAIMARTGTGMQLEVWLSKAGGTAQ